MAGTDHTDVSYNMSQMVYHRLPMLAESTGNDSLLSHFILEIMHEINPMAGKEEAEIGIETNYTLAEKSFMADIVAIAVVRVIAAGKSGGTTGTGAETPVQTFLKAAKAGSVEVEYDQFTLKDTYGFGTNTHDLLTRLKSDADRKARTLGWSYDLSDPIQMVISTALPVNIPFMVVLDE